jgi:hypothetical protein
MPTAATPLLHVAGGITIYLSIDLFLPASTGTMSTASKLPYLLIGRIQAFGIKAPGGGGQGQIWNLGYV